MTQKHTIEEIEQAAMTGCDVPGEYTPPEQSLFLSLRVLHWEYRHGVIDLNQAKREKKNLTDAFARQQRFHEIYEETIRIRNTMSPILTEAEKNGCPCCRKLVQLFDGRLKL